MVHLKALTVKCTAQLLPGTGQDVTIKLRIPSTCKRKTSYQNQEIIHVKNGIHTAVLKCRTHSETIKAQTTKHFKDFLQCTLTEQSTCIHETVKKGVHKYTPISMCDPSIHQVDVA